MIIGHPSEACLWGEFKLNDVDIEIGGVMATRARMPFLNHHVHEEIYTTEFTPDYSCWGPILCFTSGKNNINIIPQRTSLGEDEVWDGRGVDVHWRLREDPYEDNSSVINISGFISVTGYRMQGTTMDIGGDLWFSFEDDPLGNMMASQVVTKHCQSFFNHVVEITVLCVIPGVTPEEALVHVIGIKGDLLLISQQTQDIFLNEQPLWRALKPSGEVREKLNAGRRYPAVISIESVLSPT